ncbi:MAG: hypothetical protein AB7I25_00375 [Vicinamibacterales bacterium]
MTLTLPRRRFFVTAGLGAAGALTVPAAFVSSQTPTRDEAVMHHVGKELARLYRLHRRQNLFAEHYETFAANLRLLAVVHPDLRGAARKPRKPHDHRMRARQAEEVRQAFGIDISNEPEPAALSAKDEARVREQLGREGIGPTLLRMADAAEAKAARMARSGNAPPFRNAQLEWNLACRFEPEIQLASQIICDVASTGVGGAQAQVACRVSVIVVYLWRWLC